MQQNQSRREFLRRCTTLGVLGVASSYTTLGALSAPVLAASRPNGYRAMVCIYLVGGNDCNILIKDEDDHFDAYQDQRGDRGLDRNTLLKVDSGAEKYGIHPAMEEVKDLYNDGKVAFLANVGSLKQPTNVASYVARTANLPPKLFSHITQKDFIRAGLPFEGEQRSGWAGRIADLYNDTWSAQIPFNLSTSITNNVWQQGQDTNPYGFGGVVHIVNGYQNLVPVQNERRMAIESSYSHQYDNPLLKEFARKFKTSLSQSDFVRDALRSPIQTLTTQFPSTRVGRGLKNIATLINCRRSLGVEHTQQAFYYGMEGYDTHTALGSSQASNLKQLSQALKAFNDALTEMGLEDDVVTFTNSDFGRTSVGNFSGSDHGWGGHQLVMGGSVNGSKVYGTMPQFSGDDPQYWDNGRGILVPTTSHDQMSSTIAKWFGGFSNSELRDLFPNLNNGFWSDRDLDLGFMS
ncbi:DUF1501 domain-containing protein [Arenicella sp. 4NH20-0111]|uniref:DUF1501 domain-containing protein n=1 Tax=Arenicella sp. 4NH20-0111 TaxID=3127648 RepID=UPI00310A9C40